MNALPVPLVYDAVSVSFDYTLYAMHNYYTTTCHGYTYTHVIAYMDLYSTCNVCISLEPTLYLRQ